MDINAIIMAAGKGTRLYPLTEFTPKPLIEINGTPMIENIIQALRSRGIKDITVVTGYFNEKFEYLIDMYGVNIIYNKEFDKANNIASLYYAKEKLGRTIILDGDQIINNPQIIDVGFLKSGYTCFPIKWFKNEWILTLDENKKITSCSRNGGDKGYELKSLSYWTESDSKILKQRLIEEFEIKKNRDIYWDDVMMFLHPHEVDLYGYVVNEDDIIEIDCLDELYLRDDSYEERVREYEKIISKNER